MGSRAGASIFQRARSSNMSRAIAEPTKQAEKQRVEKRAAKPTKAITTQPPRRPPETVPVKTEQSSAILEAQRRVQMQIPSGFVEMDEENL